MKRIALLLAALLMFSLTGMLTTSEEAGIRSPRPSSGGMPS